MLRSQREKSKGKWSGICSEKPEKPRKTTTFASNNIKKIKRLSKLKTSKMIMSKYLRINEKKKTPKNYCDYIPC